MPGEEVHALNPERAQRGLDLLPGRAAEDGRGHARFTELPQDLGDVDAFAAGVGAHGRDPVDLAQTERGDLHGFIQRGIERNGIDHDRASK